MMGIIRNTFFCLTALTLCPSAWAFYDSLADSETQPKQKASSYRHTADEFLHRSHDLINGREGMWKIEAVFSYQRLREPLARLREQGNQALNQIAKEEGQIHPLDLDANPLQHLMLYSYEEMNRIQILPPENQAAPDQAPILAGRQTYAEAQQFLESIADLTSPITTQYYFKLRNTDVSVQVDANQNMANEFRTQQLKQEANRVGLAAGIGAFAAQSAWNGRSYYVPLEEAAKATGHGAGFRNRVWQPLVSGPVQTARQFAKAGYKGLAARIKSPRAGLLLFVPAAVGFGVKYLHQTHSDLFSRDITKAQAATELHNVWTNQGHINPATLLLVMAEDAKWRKENDPERYAICQEDAPTLRNYEGHDLVHTFDIHGTEGLLQVLDELNDTSELEQFVDQQEAWIEAELDALKAESPLEYEEYLLQIMETLHVSEEAYLSGHLFGENLIDRTATAIRQYLNNCTLVFPFKVEVSEENRMRWMGKNLDEMKVDWESIKDNPLVQSLDRDWFTE